MNTFKTKFDSIFDEITEGIVATHPYDQERVLKGLLVFMGDSSPELNKEVPMQRNSPWSFGGRQDGSEFHLVFSTIREGKSLASNKDMLVSYVKGMIEKYSQTEFGAGIDLSDVELIEVSDDHAVFKLFKTGGN